MHKHLTFFRLSQSYSCLGPSIVSATLARTSCPGTKYNYVGGHLPTCARSIGPYSADSLGSGMDRRVFRGLHQPGCPEPNSLSAPDQFYSVTTIASDRAQFQRGVSPAHGRLLEGAAPSLATVEAHLKFSWTLRTSTAVLAADGSAAHDAFQPPSPGDKILHSIRTREGIHVLDTPSIHGSDGCCRRQPTSRVGEVGH
jgi:hypothetical protein